MQCPNCGLDIEKHPANRCLDAWVAKLMGWHVGWDDIEDAHFYYSGEEVSNTDCIYIECYISTWRPSTDISAAYTMEERIKELGLEHQYVIEMVMIVGGYKHISDVVIRIGRGLSANELFAVIHATPEDRCRAALKAIAERK